MNPVKIKFANNSTIDDRIYKCLVSTPHDKPPPPHWALELNYVPLQGIYQVFGYGYPNIVLHGKMSQRMTNKYL